MLKGYVYYPLPWKHMTTTFGLFQAAYQGSPMSSFIDLGGMPVRKSRSKPRTSLAAASGSNMSTDANGDITVGTPYDRRTPWYTQTDFNLSHAIKVNKNNEHQVLNLYRKLHQPAQPARRHRVLGGVQLESLR